MSEPDQGEGGQTYAILDGVRRAKAAWLLGKPTIPACLQTEDGSLSPPFDVRLDALRSPFKDTIDFITQSDILRWYDVQEATRDGVPLPPIIVQPGTMGVTLDGIDFNTDE